MLWPCELGHGLGNPVPLRVRPAARHVVCKTINSLNLFNQNLKSVTRRSLAILPILPVMPLTVDGEPKSMFTSEPEARPATDCCQHGLMAAIKAAEPGDTVLIPGGT